ncbi:MAG: amidohydrolase family protein [Pseudomonadales bacterium]|nr:amidohydrolase family protein [Pseudomonadales bacterium]
MNRLFLTAWAATFFLVMPALAQETATPNGIADERNNALALTGASIYLPNGSYLEEGMILIREGLISTVTDVEEIPDGYFRIDMSGKHIYPGLVEIDSGYGLPEPAGPAARGGAETLESSGLAYNANDAIRAHYRAALHFKPEEKQRDELRQLGFSTALSLHADGIARGTSALVTLGNHNANEAIILSDAAAHYSFNKGSSAQTIPVSLMGSVALLRQTYLDAQWFEPQSPRPFADESLEAWIRTQSLPQIMSVENWHQALTAHNIAQEFDSRYIIRMGTDGYQQAAALAAIGARFIVPVNYPEAPKVADPFITDEIPFADLKHWELAPFNLRLLHEQGIEFAVTSSGSADKFWKNLRLAVRNGLPEEVAIASISSVPAQMLGMEERVGQLRSGALANLLVTSGPLFAEDTRLLENWVRGERFVLATDLDQRRGNYTLAAGNRVLTVALDFEAGKPDATLIDSTSGEALENARIELSVQGEDLINLSFSLDGDSGSTRLSGWATDTGWQGSGLTAGGDSIDWRLSYTTPLAEDTTETEAEAAAQLPALPSPILYPFAAYGSESVPVQRDTLIRNATVWTNEDIGTLVTDVLIRDGRIAAVGNNLSANNVLEIDGSGKHLTPGIIDEHTHIALFSINEVATNSSMVRMQDVVNSQDVNIYRNLAGGVVAAQQLHGSANPIGGQSSLIKLRWGLPPDQLKIEDAPAFIKFALGENVKRSTNPASIRYPQTRMGVEQVFMDAFSQARAYEQRWNSYENLSNAQRRNAIRPRRDLVHETMLEILNGERYVTNHSYVQSEINMMMHIADSFDFTINTFTHILEGYKVADKMTAHGAGGSTFSDWWAYKWEVRYAIPYNAALMQQAGVVVALNSDDAEMSRRLNQEAGKMVKYGNVSESDALKMITLNPARLLHLDDRMGSIRVGKDADLVLWNEHPLSVYALAQTTWVDGIAYFDRQRDQQLRDTIAAERARIIAAIGNTNSSSSTASAQE